MINWKILIGWQLVSTVKHSDEGQSMLNDAVTPPIAQIFLHNINWKPVSQTVAKCVDCKMCFNLGTMKHTVIKNTSCIPHTFGNCSEYRWKMYFILAQIENTAIYCQDLGIDLHNYKKYYIPNCVIYHIGNFYFSLEQSFQWKVWNFCSHGTNSLGVQIFCDRISNNVFSVLFNKKISITK